MKNNSPVFEELLILEIEERPYLWDQRLDVKMRGINTIRKAWEDVGRILSMYKFLLHDGSFPTRNISRQIAFYDYVSTEGQSRVRIESELGWGENCSG